MALYSRISAPLLTIALASLASIADAESPEIFIWDVLKRPNYVVAYQKMMAGEKHLPPWVATSKQLSVSVTTEAGEVLTIGGDTEEVFVMCKAHYCDTTGFVIFFGQYGDVAKSALSLNGNLRFFGYPTADERKALVSKLPPN
jgi:hypothetical protein